MRTDYTSPKLDLMREHPWWKEHDNRKLVLQNLPEEYRWHRMHTFAQAPLPYYPSSRQAVLFPSDWHNIVEHMMPARATEYFLVLLEDISVQYGLGSFAGVEIFRSAVSSWMAAWRGSASTLLQKLLDPADDGHLPRVRAERWSQRIRSQKALLTKIKDDTAGNHPAYVRPSFLYEVSASVARYSYPEDDALVQRMQKTLRAWDDTRQRSAKQGVPLDTFTLFGFPATHAHGAPAWNGAWLKTFFTKSGQLIMLPKELTQQTQFVYRNTLIAADLEVSEWTEIPIREDNVTRDARLVLASGSSFADRSKTEYTDVPAALETLYPDFKWLRPRKAEENTAVDPKRKYAVPTTFLPPDPTEVAAEPEPAWEPPAMPGVGGGR